MQSEHKARSFFFEASPAGYFEDDPLPSSAGRYRYMPYRNLAHLRLHAYLKSRGPQRCHYVIAGKKCEFTVLSCPSYGLLELAEFDGSSS
jgi:hypothetical protein